MSFHNPFLDTFEAAEAFRQSSTFKTYESALRQFKQWGGLLPCSAQKVEQYLVYQSTKEQGALSASSLMVHVAAIKYWHDNHRLNDPTSHLRIKQTISGIRKHQKKIPKAAKPLPLGAVQKLLEYLVPLHGSIIDLRNRALIGTFLVTGYRRSMIADIELEHVENIFGKGPLIITLPFHKGDSAGHGTLSKIPFHGGDYCPATWLRAYINGAGLTTGKLFRSLDKLGNTKNSISLEGVSYAVNRILVLSGVKELGYSTHSFRKTFGNLAHGAQITDKEAMLQAGWKSIQVYNEHYKDKAIAREGKAAENIALFLNDVLNLNSIKVKNK